MVKKLYKEKYLHKKIFLKSSTTTISIPPAFSFSSLLSENRNNSENVLPVNTLRSSELT